MTIKDLLKTVEEEGLDLSLVDSGSSQYGKIRFYDGEEPGKYHVELNGERGPIYEYHDISEDEACKIVLDLLRSLSTKKVR